MDLDQLRKDGREVRYDVGGLRGRGSRTPQGFLRVPGNLTRIGVLTYHRSDGSEFHELRHPDEVFNADSLGTLSLAPVTERHPGGLVTPRNVREVQVGIVTEARSDGRFVVGDLVIQNDQTISKVIRGDLRELSPGYTCRIENSSGTFHGEHYDGIQRAIVYNHLAMGPREWGRAGPDVALKLDGQDAPASAELWACERYDAHAHGLLQRTYSGAGGLIFQQMDLQGVTPAELATQAGVDEFRLEAIVAGFDFPTLTEARAFAAALGIDAATMINLIPEADRRDAAATRTDQGRNAPTRAMSREELQEARQRRSSAFGIEVLETGSNLTFPAGFPRDLADYADPVNLKFPILPAGRARNARARFKQTGTDTYSQTKSRRVVHTRIVERLLEIGARPSIDPDDPLDKLLPSRLRERAEAARRGDSRKGQTMDTKTIRIDSVDVEVQASHMSLVEKALSDRDARIAAFEKRADQAEGKVDGLTKERDELKVKVDEATSPKALSDRVAARVDLEKAGRKVLGAEAKFDGKTDREVKVDVLKSTDSSFDPEGKSDDYVDGRFDTVIAAAPERNFSRDRTREAIAANRQPSTRRTDAGAGDKVHIDSAEAAHKQMKIDAAELARKPLRVSLSQR